LHSRDYIYRPECSDPTLWDVDSVSPRGALRVLPRVLTVWSLLLAASSLVLAQTPPRPGQMPTLPLTQLD